MINLLRQVMSEDQNQRGKLFFLNANNLPRKILPWKLITLKKVDLNGLCLKESFAFGKESKTFKGREGINLLVHACHSISLFFFRFLIFLFSFFFSSFLNTCFRIVIFS